MEWTCPECSTVMDDDQETKTLHRVEHTMDRFMTQIQTMIRHSSGQELAVKVTDIVARSNRTVDDVLGLYSEALKKVMDSGLYG